MCDGDRTNMIRSIEKTERDEITYGILSAVDHLLLCHRFLDTKSS